MVDFDLNRGAMKLEKEQQKRREEVRKRKEKEEKIRREKAERDQILATIRAAEEERREREAAVKEQEQQQEIRLTAGIDFQRHYRLGQIFLINDDVAGGDKVILSEDCLQNLSQQDAFALGPITLRLFHVKTQSSEPVRLFKRATPFNITNRSIRPLLLMLEYSNLMLLLVISA
jgi:hypothetical protein